MLSMYITNDAKTWDGWLEQADKAAAENVGKDYSAPENPSGKLKTKLDIVRRYMKETFNIDIEVLRATVQRRQAEISAGKVNLTDITVK